MLITGHRNAPPDFNEPEQPVEPNLDAVDVRLISSRRAYVRQAAPVISEASVDGVSSFITDGLKVSSIAKPTRIESPVRVV